MGSSTRATPVASEEAKTQPLYELIPPWWDWRESMLSRLCREDKNQTVEGLGLSLNL
jgi:hypothetical protein